MKTIYTCEVCGKHFTDYKECSDHEKVCQEEHATGVRIAKDIEALLRQAKAAGVGIVLDCQGDPVDLDSVEYRTDKKRVYIAFGT